MRKELESYANLDVHSVELEQACQGVLGFLDSVLQHELDLTGHYACPKDCLSS